MGNGVEVILKGLFLASFSIIFVFSNKQINVKKCPSWCTLLGFELTTFGTRVSSHNH